MSRILEMRTLEAIQAKGWSMMYPVLGMVRISLGLLGSLMVKKGQWKTNGVLTVWTLLEFLDDSGQVNYGSKVV